MIELEVIDIRNAENPSEAYILVLRAKNENYIIPVMIGWSEARSLVMAMNRNSVPRRPTTHDLFISLAEKTSFIIKYIYISHFEEGVFFSLINMRGVENQEFNIDSRTTDAVTLAIKCKVPIYIDKELFRDKSIILKSITQEPEKPFLDEEEPMSDDNYIAYHLKNMSIHELEDMLDGAVGSEDFELAAKIHAELENRKNNFTH